MKNKMPSEYQHNTLALDIETMPQETLAFPLRRELAWGNPSPPKLYNRI
jgi:hypothetical protein